uniref:F-actin monooxygenase n=1 Tax=Culicoides sonorensis TaxID=179676 RepID=A0A336MWJ0_CULSO
MNRTELTMEQHQQLIMENDQAALATEMFDHFCSATTMRQILGLSRNMLDAINLRPGPLNEFYPKLKSKIKSWKAQALWKKFDLRASHRVYNKGTACAGTKVLVIGAGPCGLRTAIEAQLLGAKVVVVEKRDRITRNNVLHLWPFLITDLRMLGAKKFYGKFCAGSIDHISIRQLQCILLKVALLLGVEIHEGVSFIKTIEPKDGYGWRAQLSPEDHAVSHYEFDALVGADGKRNTLDGFKRKEFRGKLAIAITANFINKKTEAEAKVEEISGVAFIFNQRFFKELYQTTGIDLENIVYYKDDTHYFVMTAKKHSLIDKGVIIQDYADPAELLSPGNVDTSKLLDYAREAADFSTQYQMPNLEFAVNHYGKPDVAMFDFTSMFAAENSCRVQVRKNYRLFSCLVGDSLLEPFWPTGSGCARGFLSSMDAAYAIKLFANPRNSILAVLAQRESIYRLLGQTTPENLNRDIGAYTLDPITRYPNLNKAAVTIVQVKHLLDTDDPTLLEQTHLDTNVLAERAMEGPLKRKRRTIETVSLSSVLLRWVKSHLKGYEFIHGITEVSQCFTQGQVLLHLIHRFRPELIDLSLINEWSPEQCNERAFYLFEKEFGIPQIMTGKDSIHIDNVESKVWITYLEQICEMFRGEVPHVKHPKLDYSEFKKPTAAGMTMADFSRMRRGEVNAQAKKLHEPPGTSRKSGAAPEEEKYNVMRKQRRLAQEQVTPIQGHHVKSPPPEPTRKSRKRRSYEKFGNIDERTKRLQEIEENRLDRQAKRRMQRAAQTENFLKSLHMLQANTYLRESDSSGNFEDYSIYMYRQDAPEFNHRVKELEKKLLYPDRERGILSAMPGSIDPQFNDRIKDMEQRITAKGVMNTDKKPKDLLRAIGKIDQNDWQVKEIEKKMELSKKTTDIGKSRERVPKWNREQFLARQNKLTSGEKVEDSKYKDLDNAMKAIDKQLKEGSILEGAKNKVASIAGQFKRKEESESDDGKVKKSPKTGKPSGFALTSGSSSETCHFCKQRVYLMEKVTAENLVLHRSCLKCHHCHTSLRLGGYAFDRDDPQGKFYCTQHYRLEPKEIKLPQRRPLPRLPISAKTTPAKTTDMIDRGQTPERIEFENADPMSDGEPSLEQVIDENEWTDKNFGTGSEESEDDLSSSDESDSDSESDIFEDPVGSPLGAQTLQLANDWIDRRYSNMQDSDDDFYEYSSEDEDAHDSQTEGEELARAREIRKQEVQLKPLPILPTDTETDIVSKQTGLNSVDDEFYDLSINNGHENGHDEEFELASENPNPEEIKLKEKQSRKEKFLNKMTEKLSPPKTSFFGGIKNIISSTFKGKKDHQKESPESEKPENPAKKYEYNEEEEFTFKSIKEIQRQLSKEQFKEETDGILKQIEDDRINLDKAMKEIEHKSFAEKMASVKSQIPVSRVNVNTNQDEKLNKFFGGKKQENTRRASNKNVELVKEHTFNGGSKSPKQNSRDTSPSLVPKNKVTNEEIVKYFPPSPAQIKRTFKSNSSTPSTFNSNEQSPIMGRKNYNPNAAADALKSPHLVAAVQNKEKPAQNLPPPKKNILATQPLSKQPPKPNVLAAQPLAKSKIPVPSTPPPARKNILAYQHTAKDIVNAYNEHLNNNNHSNGIDELDMFDKCLDGANDDMKIDGIKRKSECDEDEIIDALIQDARLERSPSTDYRELIDDNSPIERFLDNFEELVKPITNEKGKKSQKSVNKDAVVMRRPSPKKKKIEENREKRHSDLTLEELMIIETDHLANHSHTPPEDTPKYYEFENKNIESQQNVERQPINEQGLERLQEIMAIRRCSRENFDLLNTATRQTNGEQQKSDSRPSSKPASRQNSKKGRSENRKDESNEKPPKSELRSDLMRQNVECEVNGNGSRRNSLKSPKSPKSPKEKQKFFNETINDVQNQKLNDISNKISNETNTPPISPKKLESPKQSKENNLSFEQEIKNEFHKTPKRPMSPKDQNKIEDKFNFDKNSIVDDRRNSGGTTIANILSMIETNTEVLEKEMDQIIQAQNTRKKSMDNVEEEFKAAVNVLENQSPKIMRRSSLEETRKAAKEFLAQQRQAQAALGDAVDENAKSSEKAGKTNDDEPPKTPKRSFDETRRAAREFLMIKRQESMAESQSSAPNSPKEEKTEHAIEQSIQIVSAQIPTKLNGTENPSKEEQITPKLQNGLDCSNQNEIERTQIQTNKSDSVKESTELIESKEDFLKKMMNQSDTKQKIDKMFEETKREMMEKEKQQKLNNGPQIVKVEEKTIAEPGPPIQVKKITQAPETVRPQKVESKSVEPKEEKPENKVEPKTTINEPILDKKPPIADTVNDQPTPTKSKKKKNGSKSKNSSKSNSSEEEKAGKPIKPPRTSRQLNGEGKISPEEKKPIETKLTEPKMNGSSEYNENEVPKIQDTNISKVTVKESDIALVNTPKLKQISDLNEKTNKEESKPSQEKNAVAPAPPVRNSQGIPQDYRDILREIQGGIVDLEYYSDEDSDTFLLRAKSPEKPVKITELPHPQIASLSEFVENKNQTPNSKSNYLEENSNLPSKAQLIHTKSNIISEQIPLVSERAHILPERAQLTLSDLKLDAKELPASNSPISFKKGHIIDRSGNSVLRSGEMNQNDSEFIEKRFNDGDVGELVDLNPERPRRRFKSHTPKSPEDSLSPDEAEPKKKPLEKSRDEIKYDVYKKILEKYEKLPLTYKSIYENEQRPKIVVSSPMDNFYRFEDGQHTLHTFDTKYLAPGGSGSHVTPNNHERSQSPEVKSEALEKFYETHKKKERFMLNDQEPPSRPMRTGREMLKNLPPTSFDDSDDDTPYQSQYMKKRLAEQKLLQSPNDMPSRPPRQSAPDPEITKLLNKSQRLHDKKQNFLQEKMGNRNPYIKSMLEVERSHDQELDEDIKDTAKIRKSTYVPKYTSTYTPSTSSYTPSSSYTPVSSHIATSAYLHNHTPHTTKSSSGIGTSSRWRTSDYTSPLSSSSHLSTSPRITSTSILGSIRRPHFDTSSIRSPPTTSSYSSSRHTKDNCGQSDSDSADVELNSATEISTDSEFDHDPVSRDPPPKILVDSTYMRNNFKPSRFQIKATDIEHIYQPPKIPIYEPKPVHFKPLVEVDPTIKLTSNRNALQNPRPGDYSLQKIASTEAVAAKKSLELKKRYLLGETQSTGILKSDSASALDLKLKSFQSNISECQKLLNPAPDISTAMKTFLNNTNKLTESTLKGPKNHDSVKIDEKENVNVVNVTEKNEINQSKSENNRKVSVPRDEYIHVEARKVNIEIIDNDDDDEDDDDIHQGLDKENNDSVEVIDLVTPQNSPMNVSQKYSNNYPINKNLYIAQMIDLTGDSPTKDRSLVETKVNFSVDNKEKTSNNQEFSVVPDILSTHNLKNVQEGSDKEQKSKEEKEKRPESPLMETSIEVPVIPWRPKGVSDMESDSLSESSTSSIDDIPHFALDSTTSPEQCERKIPKLEIRDETGEVMQIDSLMIINGEYIGYPDDENEISEVVGKDPDSQAEPLITPQSESREFVQEIHKSPTVIEVKPISIKTYQNTKTSNIEKSDDDIQKPRPEYKGMKNYRPEYRFDTKNESKIDTLKNLPLIVGNSAREFMKVALPQSTDTPTSIEKPSVLNLATHKSSNEKSDDDKTPINQLAPLENLSMSDTETEVTGQLLTETELSDWTADDAVSENFIDSEFVMNSNKGTIRKNRKNKKKNGTSTRTTTHLKPVEQTIPARAPLALDMDEMEFMDTGSEDSCVESANTQNNRIKFKNSGYIEFVPNGGNHQQSNSVNYSYKCDSAYSSSPKIDRRVGGNEPESLDSIDQEKAGIDYIEQGASILLSGSMSCSESNQLKTPVNNDVSETMRTSSSPTYPNSLMGSMTSSLGSSISTLKNSENAPDSLNDMEEDSLVMIMSAETITTTEESDALTVVTSPLDSTPAQILTTESSDTKTTTDSTPKKPELAKQGSEEISYEEYVKQLQAKISKITSQEPSRRKSSKGDTISSTSVTEQSNNTKENSNQVKHSPYSEAISEPPTLSKKIEQITMERDKQKDLIHDLVMDKLQQKKRLNAEKRLNRSRTRTAALSSAVASPSQTPPNQDTPVKYNPLLTQSKSIQPSIGSREPSVTSNSGTVYTTRQVPLKDTSSASDLNGNKRTPVSYSSTFSFTDKLRQEARQRARLLSNEDLGLSPEEKIQHLRKKFNIYPKSASQDRPQSSETKIVSAVPAHVIPERKLISSKSVSDILLCNNPAYSSVYSASDRPSIREIYQVTDFTSDPNLNENVDKHLRERRLNKKDPERRRSLIQAVSDFFTQKKKEGTTTSSSSTSPVKETGINRNLPQTIDSQSRFGRFRLTSRKKDDDKAKTREKSPYYERSRSEDHLENKHVLAKRVHVYDDYDEQPPPVPPLPSSYELQSDDDDYEINETKNELKRIRAITKASRQAELKRLRIAQEIQREQEEIEVEVRDLESRGVEIEKELRGENLTRDQTVPDSSQNSGRPSASGATDRVLLEELFEIWRKITQLKKRDEELNIRQQELQLEHRHAQLKEQLDLRLSCNKLDKSSSDVAAEGAILNEMLEIVAKRASLRPSETAGTSSSKFET